MLVHELFPELAKQILDDLRKLKRSDLAARVMNLRIVDRCRCGSEVCGTFYTEGAHSKRRAGTRGASIILNCGANLMEAGGRIVEIEILDPRVTEAVRRVIP